MICLSKTDATLSLRIKTEYKNAIIGKVEVIGE